MKKNPLVSIIIPTYKRADNLIKTLESVLKQSYKNIEIFIIDDNGKETDFQLETEKILSKYITSNQVRYIKHETNKNGSAARNTGFKSSKGEYILFLDDDDELFPEYVKKGVETLHETKDNIGACYCNSKILFYNRTKILTRYTNITEEGNLCLGYLKGKYFFNTSAILFKRNALERLNGFDESFRRHQDYELMTRFFTLFEIKCSSNEPLLLYDVTKNRTYLNTAEKDFILKKKFLTDLRPYLKKLGIYREISHWFWFNVMETSILSKQFSYFPKATVLSLNYGLFSLKEIYRILRLTIKLFI